MKELDSGNLQKLLSHEIKEYACFFRKEKCLTDKEFCNYPLALDIKVF